MAVTGFGEIAEKLRRSTDLIHAGGRGSGSGVIGSSDGIIITNAHVSRGTRISLQLWDGNLRGDYSWVRRVTLQLGVQNPSRSFAAA
jgi:S1-C subfamily serine protease